jgi:hypothetical protein
VLLRGGRVMFCRAKRREKMIFLHVRFFLAILLMLRPNRFR